MRSAVSLIVRGCHCPPHPHPPATQTGAFLENNEAETPRRFLPLHFPPAKEPKQIFAPNPRPPPAVEPGNGRRTNVPEQQLSAALRRWWRRVSLSLRRRVPLAEVGLIIHTLIEKA